MSSPEQLDMFEGNKQKDLGMQKAINNADYKIPSWSDRALDFVKKYPHIRFMTEEVRIWAYANGLPKAPSARAWGAIIKRAEKAGIVKHSGVFNFVKNPKAHRTPPAVWLKVI